MKTGAGDTQRLVADGWTLVNTAGDERQVVFNLPATPALWQLQEVVLLINGGNGQMLDMDITDFRFVPVNDPA